MPERMPFSHASVVGSETGSMQKPVPLRSSAARSGSVSSSAGTRSDRSALPLRLRLVRPVSSASWAGIVSLPRRLLLLRSSAVTRVGVPPRVTPCHADSGALRNTTSKLVFRAGAPGPPVAHSKVRPPLGSVSVASSKASVIPCRANEPRVWVWRPGVPMRTLRPSKWAALPCGVSRSVKAPLLLSRSAATSV